jgi:glycosyltransferase involved in cell wall biosynthesis
LLSDPLVSVLTPSIPSRRKYLDECVASVQAQTFTEHEHLVGIDQDREGCAVTVNKLAKRARGEWLLIVADDDLLLPRCIESLLEVASDADIVYAPPLVWGSNSPHYFQQPPYIPSFALIYKELWDEIGGYREDAIREEDRKFWIEALRLDAKFVRYDAEPTWVYRLHAGSKSYNEGIAA